MENPIKTPITCEVKITKTEYIVWDDGKTVIAKCNYKEHALYIQHAVNQHEKLIDLMRIAVEAHNNQNNYDFQTPITYEEWIKKAEQLLAEENNV